METTNIYIACESPDLAESREAAHRIAVQKGCDPVSVPWPRKGISEEQARLLQSQFKETIRSCDLFVAIIDHSYGELRLDSPHSPNRVNALHYEILEVCNMQNPKPEILVFALAAQRAPEVQSMLDEAKQYVTKYQTPMQFRKQFSARLSEYQDGCLIQYLASLHRIKIAVTCPDQSGLLAAVAEAISNLQGNLASGNQTTSGSLAILHFVAEWPYDKIPNDRIIDHALTPALPADPATTIKITRVGPGEPEVRTKIQFLITFIDHPGVANLIFSQLKEQNTSVFSTSIDTFTSGGIMLGRIYFSLNGDAFPRDAQSLLAERLRKLPGILTVDSTALRGRYWT